MPSVIFAAHYQESWVPTVFPKQVLTLVVGDFIWLLQKEDEFRLAGTIVERKTCTDLLNSVWDGRLKDQTSRLLASGRLSRVIIIVEGSLVDSQYRRLSEKVMYGLEEIGIEVVRTKNVAETGTVLDSITADLCATQPLFDTLIPYEQFVAECRRPTFNDETKRLLKILNCCEGIGEVSRGAVLKSIEEHGGLSVSNLLSCLDAKNIKLFAQRVKETGGLQRAPSIAALERIREKLSDTA